MSLFFSAARISIHAYFNSMVSTLLYLQQSTLLLSKFLKRLQMVLHNLLETMNSDYIPRKTKE